jgi:hypothetical protein
VSSVHAESRDLRLANFATKRGRRESGDGINKPAASTRRQTLDAKRRLAADNAK